MRSKVYGVGFIGEGKFKSSLNGVRSKAHKTWTGMLERCYSEKCHARNPTYKECSVCDEWHNFQNFAKWFFKNYIKGFELDKDIKVKGNKIYSPDTCIFVSPKKNRGHSSIKEYLLLSPEGEIVKVRNMKEFCKDKPLHTSRMSLLVTGKITNYNGWKLA
jgi:hypothetical protein